MMINKVMTANTESTNLPEQPPQNPKGPKWFGKKLYVLIAAVILVVIIVGALLIPQGAASIPLTVNYNVGEKMVYTISLSLGLNLNGSTLFGNQGSKSSNSTTGKETIEVLSFDGEFYTLNNTISANEAYIPSNYSMIEKMDKTGYSVFLFNMGNTSAEITNNSPTSAQYLAQLLSKPEVKVGDKVTVPYPALPSNLSSDIQVTGDLTLTFKGFQDLTVPAGTYKVFRVDLTSNNLTMTFKTPSVGVSSAVPKSVTINPDMNYQVYLEYGTMRLIESSMQETLEFQSTSFSYTMGTAMNMTLSQDINP